MFSFKRLFIIITTFIGMTCGCEYDRFGNPILLHSDTMMPHRLVSDCWYSVSVSQTQHVSTVIERPSETDKLAVYWEELDTVALFAVLFDWNGVPIYNVQQNRFQYNFFLSHLGGDGFTVYQLNTNKQDIYHCLDGYYGCDAYKDTASIGDLYIKFISLGLSEANIGRFKVSWVKSRPYIQPSQLLSVKNMWNDCCKDTFVHSSTVNTITTNIDYQTIFTKTNCDLVIGHNLSLDSLTENSCEDIEHVTCDDEGNVIGLYVGDRGLKCDNFVEHVMKFPKLIELFASKNHLSGNIESLSNLNELVSVALYDNYFTGRVPCFTNPNMTSIDIGMNKLNGIIPSCLEKLYNLNILDLSNNQFNTQQFPYFLKMFEKLEILALTNTNLHGTIDNVFNLPSLQLLRIGSNHLNGSLPPSLVQSDTLSIVDVSFNFLSGKIPNPGHSQVQGFYGMNSFNGNLVELLKNAQFNSLLDISHNKFEGTIPDEAVKLLITKNLRVLMKGNLFECDQGTDSWSKSILHMNSVLNLGKCSMNTEDPCDPSEPCQNSTLSLGDISGISDDNTNNSAYIITILIISIILNCIVLFIYLWYRLKTKPIQYMQTKDPEELSVLKNSETTV